MVKPVHLLQPGKEVGPGNHIKGTLAPAQLRTPLEASAAIPTVSLVSISWEDWGWHQGYPAHQKVARVASLGGCMDHCQEIQLDYMPFWEGSGHSAEGHMS